MVIVGQDVIAAMDSGGNMAALLQAEATGGTVFLGFIAAVAFATILAVVAGLTLSGASTLSNDLYVSVFRYGKSSEEEEVKVARIATLGLGVAGDPGPGSRLRRHLLRRIAERPLVLRYLTREAVRFSPPLGLFNKFIVQKSGMNKGGLDVKKGGIFPLTQGVRTLAAEHGVLAASTEERIMGLRAMGALSAGFGARMRDAYAFFHVLRTASQAEKVATGRKPDNFIIPDRLSATEQKRLRACLATVTEFQALLTKKYELHLLT